MELRELYLGCRSYRRFTQKKVPKEVILEAIENARMASSGDSNAQPVYYYGVTTPAVVEAMQPMLKWGAAIPKGEGTPKSGETPTAFVVVMKRSDAKSMSDIDVGIAVNMLVTTAWSQGIGSCIIGYIDRDRIAELLGTNPKDTIRLVVALGYPSHESHLVEQQGNAYKYYLDAKKDYCVPKRALKDILIWK